MGFLEAKKEWLERYGTYINQAKNWRLIAILSLAIAVIMGVGFYTQAVRTHVVPYVVYINKSGNIRDVKLLKPLTQNAGLSPMTIRYYVNQYITYTFGNIASRIVTKERVNKVVEESLPGAKGVIVNYLRANNPFLEKHIRLVKVHYILQKPDGSYTVSFTVSEINKAGISIIMVNYIATVGIAVVPPATLKQAEINPLGIYIKYFSFTKE
jgi:type IV secretion system protein VirB5